MAKPLPPPPVPKAKQSGSGSAWDKWVKQHKAIGPYANLVVKWAKTYKVDRFYLASLILAESGGNPNAGSRQGAVGLAQIHLPSWPGVTRAQARNPNFAIHWAAEKMAGYIRQEGSFKAAYLNRYNPNDPNKAKAWSNIARFAKGAPAGGSDAGLDPTEQVDLSIAKSRRKEDITKEDFNRRWGEYNDIFEAYAGRKATKKEAERLNKVGWSFTTIARGLSKQKAFFKSPIWTAKADEYLGSAKDMGVPADKHLVAKAIVNNWSGVKFQEELRRKPAYLTSNEFRTQEAGFVNNYRTLYGEPTPEITTQVKRAVLGRWTPDQWSSYLRSLPQYRQSSEYQGKASELQAMLGFVDTTADPAPPPIPGRRPPPPRPPR